MENSEKFKICVAGAVETNACGLDVLDLAKEIGEEIAKHKGVLITGAGSGFPLWAATGAKEAGGLTLMFSPAGSKREHKEAYRLPDHVHDIIVYTGFGYTGSDLLMTKSSDAVIIGCGRVGTIHEFTMAYEEGKPVGVLEGAWDTDDIIKTIIGKKGRTDKPIIFEKDPKKLVSKLLEILKSRS
ncbi:MAG: hypothetical protein QG654_250 [Patescibacteria group bacterium]|jgi:uncharacterized protein (TIGR00725 family)|nr:hypothetical protein [Patescibacteria group bacterium]